MTGEQIQARRQANKRRAYLARTGRPCTVTGPEVERVKAKVRVFHARGMSYAQMVDQVGVPHNTISMQMNRGSASMLRKTYEALKGLRFEEPASSVLVDCTGTVRRLGSMWHDGFTLDFQAQELGCTKPHLQSLLRGDKGLAGVTYRMSRAVRDLYDRLLTTGPAEFGIPARSVRYCKSFAVKKGTVPRSCWDGDTIDDPDAFPDWTGRCGTRFGYAVHRRENIPVCAPCLQAYTGDLYPGFSGEKLRRLRERRGLSRNALAAHLNLNAATVQYWENGRNKPSRQGKLDEVLSALDGTYEDVCEDTQ